MYRRGVNRNRFTVCPSPYADLRFSVFSLGFPAPTPEIGAVAAFALVRWPFLSCLPIPAKACNVNEFWQTRKAPGAST